MADEPAENHNILNNDDENQSVEEITMIERNILRNETLDCSLMDKEVLQPNEQVQDVNQDILWAAIEDKGISENRPEKDNVTAKTVR